MGNLLFEKETFAIRGAVFDVYREMGCGFLEAVYQECLEKELKDKRIPFVSQKDISPEHKAQVINYLKATNLKSGLLINFGSHPKAQIERFAL